MIEQRRLRPLPIDARGRRPARAAAPIVRGRGAVL